MNGKFFKNVGCRLMTLLCMMVLSLVTGSALAQSGKLILTQGNAKIYQDTEGWAIYHGKVVVAHGDGVLDITNLPPAFQDFLDYYAALSLDKSPKRRLSKATSYTYGPLLRTRWHQGSPYNDLCPNIDGENAVAGCTSIATGMLLNYYGYCKPFVVSGSSSVTGSSVTSDFISNKVVNGDKITFDFSYSLAPDFANMDDKEIAKLIVGVAFAQKATFGIKETSTFTEYQY